MTHLLDSSAVLANIFGEPGANRVNAILNGQNHRVGISVLTLYETYTTVLHRTGSEAQARQAVELLKSAMTEIVPVSEMVVEEAMKLRYSSSARIATADCLIAATATLHNATLVHRDPHFAALPAGRLDQETLPQKV